MKKTIAYILSFMLTIAIVLSILVGVLANTILSKQYFLGKLEEISFYDRTAEEINDTFQNYILQSGMDETVLENIYDKQKLTQDINALVDAIYENKEIQIETESIKEKLNANIEKYLEEKQLKTSHQEEVDIFVNTIAETYKDGVVYSAKAIKQMAPVTAKASQAMQNVQPILYATTAILAFILIAIHWNRKGEIAKYLGISLLAAGLTIVIAKIYITTQLQIEGIMLLNAVVTNLIQNIANQILEYIFYLGIVSSIIGGICLIIKIMGIKEIEV